MPSDARSQCCGPAGLARSAGDECPMAAGASEVLRPSGPQHDTFILSERSEEADGCPPPRDVPLRRWGPGAPTDVRRLLLTAACSRAAGARTKPSRAFPPANGGRDPREGHKGMRHAHALVIRARQRSKVSVAVHRSVPFQDILEVRPQRAALERRCALARRRVVRRDRLLAGDSSVLPWERPESSPWLYPIFARAGPTGLPCKEQTRDNGSVTSTGFAALCGKTPLCRISNRSQSLIVASFPRVSTRGNGPVWSSSLEERRPRNSS